MTIKPNLYYHNDRVGGTEEVKGEKQGADTGRGGERRGGGEGEPSVQFIGVLIDSVMRYHMLLLLLSLSLMFLLLLEVVFVVVVVLFASLLMLLMLLRCK